QNDVAGADGSGIVGVRAANGDMTSAVVNPGSLGAAIAGLHGTLHLNTDGSYTYQSSSNNISSNTNDVFDFTIKDSDGDLSASTLSINLTDVAEAVCTLDLPALNALQGNGLNAEKPLGTLGGGFNTIVSQSTPGAFTLSFFTGVLSVGGSNVTSDHSPYTVVVSNGVTTETVKIWVGTPNDDTINVDTPGDINLAYGLNNPDTITGGSGLNFIIGGQNDNKLIAGTGTTTLVGLGQDSNDEFVINSSTVTIAGSGNNGTISGYHVIHGFDPAKD